MRTLLTLASLALLLPTPNVAAADCALFQSYREAAEAAFLFGDPEPYPGTTDCSVEGEAYTCMWIAPFDEPPLPDEIVGSITACFPDAETASLAGATFITVGDVRFSVLSIAGDLALSVGPTDAGADD
jgi:hypothetical protein